MSVRPVSLNTSNVLRSLRHHVAWVTGGGSGIGQCLAMELAQRGATVVVSGRRQERLAETVRAIEERGGRAMAVPCDVTRDGDISQAVAQIIDTYDKLDIVIANAGAGVQGTVEKLSADEWRRQLEINVIGAAMTAHHTIPHLKKSRGRLALVGSVLAYFSLPANSAYCASKAAVRALGDALYLELEPHGVSCTTLHPGFVASEIAQVDNAGVFHPDRRDPRPQWLMWRPERAARVCVQAIAKRRRSLVFTGHGKLAAALGQHAPSLVYALLALGQRC